MAAKYWLAVALLVVSIPMLVRAETLSVPAKPSTKEQAFVVEEAEAIVELYDLRLQNVKLKASQEDLKWQLVKENYFRVEQAQRSGAISERDFRDAKYDYDHWTMQDQVKDIEEAETNLKLARIRLKMAKAGLRPYGKICELGKE